MPTEFKSARLITQDRNDILRSANTEAERIIKQAEERAKVLVSNDEITKTAKAQAAELTKQAEDRARQVKVVVDGYIERIISKSEESLRVSLEEIRKTKSELKGQPLIKKK
jgi:F0F1-type ATP synthase membrane subunit b/b'